MVQNNTKIENNEVALRASFTRNSKLKTAGVVDNRREKEEVEDVE